MSDNPADQFLLVIAAIVMLGLTLGVWGLKRGRDKR